MIVDANVAVKWFVAENDSDIARSLLVVDEALKAPDVIYAELANVAWLKVRKGQLAPSVAEGMFQELRRLVDLLVPSAELVDRALALSLQLDYPSYDCFYLALAERERDVLVTADKRLIEKLAGSPFAPLVRSLTGG